MSEDVVGRIHRRTTAAMVKMPMASSALTHQMETVLVMMAWSPVPTIGRPMVMMRWCGPYPSDPVW